MGIALLVLTGGSLLLTGRSLWLVLPGVAMVGFSLPWALVGIITLIQRTTPKAMLGRVTGTFTLFVNAPP